MSMFMGQALALFKEPSAIYEWPDLTFVAINDSARILASRLPAHDDGDPQMSWVGLTDDEVRDGVESAPDGKFFATTEWGVIAFSVIEPQDHHPRPPLLLSSVHEVPAWASVDHQRLRLMLTLNEQEEILGRILETALNQVAIVQMSLRTTLKTLNEQVAEINQKKFDDAP